MIKNGIARFDVTQKIDKRNLIGLRPRERAHDEVEIHGGKPRPTIRPDHRDFMMRDQRAYGKTDIFVDESGNQKPGIELVGRDRRARPMRRTARQ
jgi:hypothetical protein